MKRLGFSFLFVLFPILAQASTYYASTSGSGATCSISSPCSLQGALDKYAAGDTVYLRGGTYTGKFTATTSGSSGSRVTIRAYPGEFPIIDGFLVTTLNGAINNSTTTVVIADASKLVIGQDLTFHDGTEGSEEIIHIGNIATNTLTVTRGWNGTTAVSHSDGATIVLGGNQVTVTGSYLTFRDLVVTNSDPTRIQTPANSQNAPHLRGEGFFITGDFAEIINCVIHDVQDGLFNGATASGTLAYGNVIFNNGYVAAGAYNGHGLYLIHEDAAQTANIKENIIFNNSNHGIKGDSQNGDTVNIFSEGNISFNSGCWANGGARNFNLLMSSNNGVANNLTVKDNFLFHIDGKNGTNLKIGLGDQGGSISVTGNYIAMGLPVVIQDYTPVTFTGNTVRGTNNSGGGSNTIIQYEPAASPTVTWDSNTYYNSITSGAGYYPFNGSSSRTFAQWKSDTGFDAGSTETLSAPGANAIFLRTNLYNSARANIVIFNWTGGTTATVTITGFLNSGDRWSAYAVEEGTFPGGTPTATGMVSGSTISLPMNGSTVASQVGSDGSVIITPVAVRPVFAAFVLIRAQVGSGNLNGNIKLTGNVKLQF